MKLTNPTKSIFEKCYFKKQIKCLDEYFLKFSLSTGALVPLL